MRENKAALHLVSIVFATNVFLGTALSAETRPFDAGQFAKDQDTGKPIVTDATADWCPICTSQKSMINALLVAKKYNGLVFYRLDFDTQRGDLGRLGSQLQSTLIAFSGKQETGRTIGDTDPRSIRALE